jgi:hypothetical protein
VPSRSLRSRGTMWLNFSLLIRGAMWLSCVVLLMFGACVVLERVSAVEADALAVCLDATNLERN